MMWTQQCVAFLDGTRGGVVRRFVTLLSSIEACQSLEWQEMAQGFTGDVKHLWTRASRGTEACWVVQVHADDSEIVWIQNRWLWKCLAAEGEEYPILARICKMLPKIAR